MDMEMIERVAMAIWEATGTESVPHSWSLLHPSFKKKMRIIAYDAVLDMALNQPVWRDQEFDQEKGA